MRKACELTLGIIKPSVAADQQQVKGAEVLQAIKATGLEIVRTRRLFWSAAEASQFYGAHDGRFYFPRLVNHATSGPSVALALAGEGAIGRWRSLIGPTHVYKAQWERQECLRAKYGLSDTRNGFHGSDSPESARDELGQVFEGWDVEWWLDQRNGEGMSEAE